MFQTLNIDVPSRRELEKNWAEPLLQLFHAHENFLSRSPGRLKLFHVRDESARFNCKHKLRRHRFPPGVERLEAGQMIMSCVDFHRIKAFTIKAQHVRGAHLFRIERAEPMFVIPAGSADENLATHSA